MKRFLATVLIIFGCAAMSGACIGAAAGDAAVTAPSANGGNTAVTVRGINDGNASATARGINDGNFFCADGQSSAAAETMGEKSRGKVTEAAEATADRQSGAEAVGTAGKALTTRSATDEIKHFFTHALVAHPELGFDAKNEMSVNYDRDCLTPREFQAILESLYQRGFVLCDVADTYEMGKEGGGRKSFLFPKGKTPLILSFDDINYYIKKMDKGMNDRLDVDAAGKFFTYTANAKDKVSYQNEVVTILENFIEKHPDFSYNGARGILCLTGFDGILGYRTQSGSKYRAEQTARARKVVSALKKKGWRIACHSYGHYHMKQLSVQRFREDTDKWLREVGAITGGTEIYVYPYGEWEVSENGRESEKHAYLKQKGFTLFCGVGERDYYTRMNGSCLFMDRKPLDGISLRKLSAQYAPYFDAAAVYDRRRPTPFPN